jgi:hypothetical protein
MGYIKERDQIYCTLLHIFLSNHQSLFTMAPTIQRVSRSTNALRNNPIVPYPPAAERVSTPGSSTSASAC